MVQGPPVAWLIANGYLSDYRAYAPSAPDLTGIHTLAGDYVKNEIDQVMKGKAIVADCVSQWRRYAAGQADHRVRGVGRALADDGRGVPARPASRPPTSTPTTPPHVRRQHILNFATGHLQVLWNCDLFSEGFDLSAIAGRDVPIECVIQARPTKSLTLHLQQVGRALRRKPYPAILLDLCGNLARLGLPDHPHEWTLAGPPEEGPGRQGRRGRPAGPEVPVVRRACSRSSCRPARIAGRPSRPAGGGRKVEEVAGELQGDRPRAGAAGAAAGAGRGQVARRADRAGQGEGLQEPRGLGEPRLYGAAAEAEPGGLARDA